MMNGHEELELMSRAARLYYQDDLTQQEVAAQLGVSRPAVSRLLSQARRQGIVQIRIVDPCEKNHDLGVQLQVSTDDAFLKRNWPRIKKAMKPVPASTILPRKGRTSAKRAKQRPEMVTVWPAPESLRETAVHAPFALAAAPAEPSVYARLASVLFGLHDVPVAIKALRAGRELAPDHVVLANDLAWTLATSDDPAYRNGAEAVEISEHAVAVTQARNASVLDTFAAALAEVGRFDDALEAADRAIALANRLDDPAFVARIENRRALYAEHKPYREVPGTPTTMPTTAPASATH